ncbi:MAG: hypothetical protein ACUVQ8_01715 [Nitrososphaeria archaeon]
MGKVKITYMKLALTILLSTYLLLAQTFGTAYTTDELESTAISFVNFLKQGQYENSTI